MSNWSQGVAVAYRAGFEGQACPNEFVAAWRQGIRHRQAQRGDTVTVTLPVAALDVIDSALASYTEDWEDELSANGEFYSDEQMQALRERIAQAAAVRNTLNSYEETR